MEGSIRARVRDFYEISPYPNQKVVKKQDLLSGEHAKVMKKIFATMGMPTGSLKGLSVLDAGCGTGEKAVYCALLGAKVDAFDISKKSISIAKETAAKLGVKVNFSVAAFETVALTKKYDIVLCIGSLHHTSDAKANFLRMARSVKKGGKIALGLYNTYGRLGCRLQRKFLWLGESSHSRVVEKVGAHKEKNQTWRAAVADRYGAPHETYHSVEEVLQWFAEAGITPVSCWPEVKINSKLHIKLAQLEWLTKGRGFFFIGGKKR